VNSVIIQDSYWFLDGEGEERTIRALCPICAKKLGKGWFWDHSLGYGNYDLFCVSCGNAIHLRGDIEASSKNE
jgi:hypothetical protein